VSVSLDRVGAVYRSGETVTGVVVVQNPSSFTHSGVFLQVEGTIQLFPSVRGLGTFEPCYASIKPVTLYSANLQLSAKGEKMPAGNIEMPFAFELKPQSPKVPLVETYQGVFISTTYTCTATLHQMFGKIASEAKVINVVVPGQFLPAPAVLDSDPGVSFSMSHENVRTGRRFNGDKVPRFHVEGHLEHLYNDIDVPLSGWIAVRFCESHITSLELQLIRVESCATLEALGREATEIQNIQIGDGDVMRGFEIPIYMFFPRLYTCPTIHLPQMRVEFEVNVVVTLEEQNQLTQNVPIKLYRSMNCS
jgi:hypothetical protein